MLARCAHCRNTFSTDRFGVQRCPHCGREVLLAEPPRPQQEPPASPPPPVGAAEEPSLPPDEPAAGAPEGVGSRPGGEPSRPTWGEPPPPVPPGAGEAPSRPTWGEPPPVRSGAGGGAPPPSPWGERPPFPPPPGPWGGGHPGYGGPYLPPPWEAAPPPGWGPLPPGIPLPPARGEGESSPFKRRRELGFVSSFGQTWRLAAFEPRRFFRFVRTQETGSAILFGIIAFTIGTWASLFYAALAGGASSAALEELLRRMPSGSYDPDTMIGFLQRASFKAIVAQALLTPIAGLVGIYVVAAIVHLLLVAVRGAPRGFSSTLTVVAYAYGMFLLEALPACGGVVAIAWFTVALIIGISESQRCGTGRAAFAVLAPALLACACGCMSAAMLAAQLGAGSASDGTTGL